MSERNGGFGSFLGGFFLGGIAGLMVAILTAPRSGEETREQIRTKGIKLRDTTEKTVDEILATVRTTAQEVRDRADDLRVQNQAVLEETQKQWTEAIGDFREVTANAIDELKKSVEESFEKTSTTTIETE